MRPGDVIAQRFEIDRIAGEGGMGTVWRARDRTGSGVVALKVMNAQGTAEAARFEREAEALRGLAHAGIVGYVAHGTTEANEPWLAMEWLDGEDLQNKLSRDGLTERESVSVAFQAAQALGAAHARGVVHRDVKPSNLFLVQGDTARTKVLDFGIARLGGLLAASSTTRTGAMMGTPGYMAPEQARGERGIDARADVFSLGCVLFECLGGRPPFVAEHVVAVLAKVLFEEAPRVGALLAGVPPELDDLVARMLAKDPTRRPNDGIAVAAELAALGEFDAVRRAPPIARPASLTEDEQRWVSVVIASGPRPVVDATAQTMQLEPPSPRDLRVAAAANENGARLELLADGSRVLLLTSTGAATDLAVRAARCALAVRAALGDAPSALATGRANTAGALPVGEALDRAAARVKRPGATTLGGVMIDETTAGLLDARFDVGGDEAGLVLRGEREVVEVTRTLLGRATPCVGRERDLATLQGIWDECVAESVSRAALVTGAAGVGKSRVRYEFVNRVRAREPAVQVWIGRADSIGAGSSFGLLAPSIRRAAGVFEGEALAVRQQKLRARVARNVPESERRRVTDFLGELIATPFSDDDNIKLRTARADRIVMGDQMRAAWEDFLLAESSIAPVLIVLEDVHWGDLPSVTLIDRALRNVRERPWMVLALARPEVDQRFPRLWSERGGQHLRLAELTARSSEKLVRAVLGDAVSAEQIARMLERSTGNAFYLEELIRAEADGKGGAVPDTVLAMVDSRLGALDAETRRVLRAASVFGQVFWRSAVATLLGSSNAATDVTTQLDELERREVIARVGEGKFAGETEYAFRHSVVREAAYGMLIEADRLLGHRLAAEWLENVGEREAVRVAEHFESGGERSRALTWFTRSAEQALAGNDFAAVIERVERAVACGAEGEALGWLQRLRCEAHKWRGEYAVGIEWGERAVGRLAEGSDGWCEAAENLLAVAGYVGDLERVGRIGERLVAVLERGGGSPPAIMATARAGLSLLYAGRREPADRMLGQCESAASALTTQNATVEGRMFQARAQRALADGDAALFLERSSAAVRAYERAGDSRNLCTAQGSVGYGLLEVGAWAESETALRNALEMAERLGLRNVAAAAKHNIGLVLARRGALAEARVIEQEAIDAFHLQGDRRLEAGGRIYLAEILALQRDFVAAEREAREAVAVVPAEHPARVYALAVLTHVLLAATPEDSAPPEALEHARDAMRILQERGSIEYGEALLRLTFAEALHRSGDVASARAEIAVARDRIMARAAKITNPARRASYLANVPEHARTLAFAQAWGAAGAHRPPEFA